MPTQEPRAYDEYVQFVTSAPSLEQIITFRPSQTTKARVRYLQQVGRSGQLTQAERSELEEFTRADRLLHDLKIRARRRLRMGADR